MINERKTPIIKFVDKDGPSISFDKSMKFLIKASIQYDAKFSEVFSTFTEWNRQQIRSVLLLRSKKYTACFAEVKDKLSYLNKKSKHGKYKCFVREIRIPTNQIPFHSKIYLPLKNNIRLDEKQSLESMIGPNSLMEVCPKQDYILFEISNKKLSYLNDLRYGSLSKLKFMIKQFQENYGYSLDNMRTMSALLNINNMTTAYYWLGRTKNLLENVGSEKEQKIYSKKYIKFFCNICHLYACNYHFLTNDDILADSEDSSSYSYYDNFYILPKKQIYYQNFKDFAFSWVHSYRCPKTAESTCFRALKEDVDIESVEKINLQKFEMELIKHCLNYNMINPCFIYLLLKNKEGYKRPCAVFFLYIMQNKLIKRRDEYIKTLKSNVEIENKNLQLQKKNNSVISRKTLKNKIWKRNQEFMEFIPCFHDGLCTEANCYCIKNFGNCEKYCGCSSFCEYLVKGCNCSGGICDNNCECLQNHRECDPEFCVRCGSKYNRRIVEKHGIKVMVCANTNLTYGIKRRLLVGKSKICDGLGIFSGERFKKNEFLGEYVGEMLNFEEAEKRGRIYALMNVYYLFTLTKNIVIANKRKVKILFFPF
jgi:hypothetical protein